MLLCVGSQLFVAGCTMVQLRLGFFEGQILSALFAIQFGVLLSNFINVGRALVDQLGLTYPFIG